MSRGNNDQYEGIVEILIQVLLLLFKKMIKNIKPT